MAMPAFMRGPVVLGTRELVPVRQKLPGLGRKLRQRDLHGSRLVTLTGCE